MHNFFNSRPIKATLLIVVALILSACQIDSDPKSELDKVRERGVLRVGTLNNQLAYYIGPEGPTGLDYELAKLFASELGVKLEIKPAYRLSELFPALQNNEIDIVAAGLSQTPERINRFRAAPAYYYVSQQLVYKAGTWKPRSVKNLVERQQEHPEDKLAIISDSHFAKTLEDLKAEYPSLTYTTNNNSDVQDLLRQVSTGELSYTIADSVEVSLAQRLYPDIALALELTEDQPVSWYMRNTDDGSLYALLIEFFGKIKQSGQLDTLEEKYFGHVDSFDYVDTRAFIRALDNKLPTWEPLFKKHAGNFDWRLIAALSYQESHWKPKATSPTGVRGMMMLTLPTAKSVGVKNRLDPEQSIQGGVKYLQGIVDRVPDSIFEHEKIWFALASYNLGYGHMMDARRLTRSQNGNPNSWADVKERLPLLKQRKFYSKTRYGYARGDEAKNYVENIRRYYQSIIGHVDKQGAISADLDIDGIQTIDVEINEQNPQQLIEQQKNPQEKDTTVETDTQTITSEEAVNNND
ncbi:membrane-bound lytic murein transglycosylase MltF [Vibrio sp. TH_r3]|uniref:membrane-bound lytic murein transglycosylase MltF n=1 Tax=Vibrio sp. TH_r3 TaxID=3082084 RepID=UPI002955B2C7|nr:membrane-bound lytic murein transglycosylase MltF [Vibrio sp. TH_r3]MDV7104989.1 membrane-bound lytic murein transglycosylase MltF [Vibrio sp. TH_r3]